MLKSSQRGKIDTSLGNIKLALYLGTPGPYRRGHAERAAVLIQRRRGQMIETIEIAGQNQTNTWVGGTLAVSVLVATFLWGLSGDR